VSRAKLTAEAEGRLADAMRHPADAQDRSRENDDPDVPGRA
jgi:hypothetical protein